AVSTVAALGISVTIARLAVAAAAAPPAPTAASAVTVVAFGFALARVPSVLLTMGLLPRLRWTFFVDRRDLLARHVLEPLVLFFLDVGGLGNFERRQCRDLVGRQRPHALQAHVRRDQRVIARDCDAKVIALLGRRQHPALLIEDVKRDAGG